MRAITNEGSTFKNYILEAGGELAELRFDKRMKVSTVRHLLEPAGFPFKLYSMGPRTDRQERQIALIGFDTEIYRYGGEPDEDGIHQWHEGLLSWQAHGFAYDGLGEKKPVEVYCEPSQEEFDSMSDDDIRRLQAGRWLTWLEHFECDVELAFYNLRYDLSQFLKFLVTESGYLVRNGNIEEDAHGIEVSDTYIKDIRKGEITITETPNRTYSVKMRTTLYGRMVTMIDVGNFIVGGLERAGREWLGEGKDVLETKVFPRGPASPEQRHYAIRDAVITHKLQLELHEQGMLGTGALTSASATMRRFKQFLKSRGTSFNDLFFQGLDDEEILNAKKMIERIMRPYYRGATTLAVQTGRFRHVWHADYHSHYPAQCVERYIPTGPLLFKPPSSGRYFTLHRPTAHLRKKNGKLPYLQWQSYNQCYRYEARTDGRESSPRDYVDECMLDGSAVYWDFEWELILEHYDIIGSFFDEPIYLKAMLNIHIKPFILELYETKRTAPKGGKKASAKICINSFYGKMASRPDGEVIVYHNGERRVAKQHDRPTLYLPFAAFITAKARVKLYRDMDSLPIEKLLYCDTDSVFWVGPEQPFSTTDDELGTFGMEHEDVEMNIVGPKAYQVLENDGNVDTKCAGMVRDVKSALAFGDLQVGREWTMEKPRRNPDTWVLEWREIRFHIEDRGNAIYHPDDPPVEEVEI